VKRVYKSAAVLPAEAGYAVALDARRVKTPGRRDLVLPTERLAAAIAEEWNAQTGEIRPAQMPLSRLANTAIDRTPAHHDKIVEEVANYAGTDLVCYRAERPPALAARQHAAWQPLLEWAAGRFDAPLEVVNGILPRTQPARSLKSFALAVAEHDDFALTALHAATTACGSLVIALALFAGRLDAEGAFAASQLDESHEIEKWGEDSEAAERRRALAADIAAAARFHTLSRG
jgi:chaperone required for assembly of F1-ATPase